MGFFIIIIILCPVNGYFFFLMEKLLAKIWYENICRVLVVYTILDIEVGLEIEVSRAQES